MKVRLLAAMIILTGFCAGSMAQKLVILHSNDTHSQLEPTKTGQGGILQRKAVIDSVKSVEKNVIVVDAGDAVQGSLYFKMFRGEADFPLMDMVGYDIRILGNHEFDNGLDDLARYWKKVKGDKLSANYDFSETAAKGVFKPWVIKKVGGKKIGFFGLNVDPESLIIASNYEGMRFSPAIATADSIAALLKKKGCDLVVAVTHIGYGRSDKESDLQLARESRDIDIIIGGHSHTLVDPANPDQTPWVVENAVGRPVVIAQTGKSGKYLGEITIDLSKVGKETPSYRLIPVTDRFEPAQLDPAMQALLNKYKASVDSVCSVRVGRVADTMENNRTGAFANWTGDFASWYGKLLLDSLRSVDPRIPPLDISVMNVGGIRSSWEKGPLDKGNVLSTFPFSNRFVVMRLKGADLMAAMSTAARKGGEAISKEALVITDADGGIVRMILGGEEVDPERIYTVGTIDYIAAGNDDLREFANGEVIYMDDVEIAAPILRYLEYLDRLGIPVSGDPRPRFIPLAD